MRSHSGSGRGSGQSATDTGERAKSVRIGPLKGLMPYLRPYRLSIVGVAAALIAASRDYQFA